MHIPHTHTHADGETDVTETYTWYRGRCFYHAQLSPFQLFNVIWYVAHGICTVYHMVVSFADV